MTRADNDRAITGDVIDHGRVLLSAPRRRLPRWPWVLSVVWVIVVLCAGAPVVLAARPFLRETAEAARGASTPSEALLRYAMSVNKPGRAGELDAEPIIVPSRRAAVLAARRAFLTARADDQRARPDWLWGDIEVSSQPGPDADPPEEHTVNGDQAVLVEYYAVMVRPANSEYAPARNSEPWRAEVRRERDGWRLWSVTIPPWCGGIDDKGRPYGYSKCGLP